MKTVERNGLVYAEIIRAGERVETSRFFSNDSSSLQFGLLAHGSGFVEPAHSHYPIERTIHGTHQMFVMQFGVVEITFHEDDGTPFNSTELGPGDAIVLMDGVHSLKVIEDFQAVSVKQGPFLGDCKDKVEL